ncbi:MAG: Rieske 2Fe-2S domain-containing protein [Acidobacteriota bacterium]
MSHSYRAVGWTPSKKRYDTDLVGGVLLYLLCFVGLGLAFFPETTPEAQVLRAFGTGAFLLLHVILAIGPLARLDARFLPLLFNRRHLGVTMFLMGLVHGAFSIVQFHGLGTLNPLVSVFVSNGRYDSVSQFPFQPLGLIALFILFLMAATSHDFWLANLSAPVWKSLHMGVYVAYALLVAHVALGALQQERHPAYVVALCLGVLTLVSLHLAASRAGEPEELDALEEEFVDVCGVEEIPMDRARIVSAAGERVAIFRHEGGLSAVSNVCQHQNGPLGEGRIIDGCITCPWHGYQYRPEDGSSPPPFTERIPTFRVRVDGDRVLLCPQPLPAGTPVPPAALGGTA